MRGRYGVDAPGLVRGFLLAGAGCGLLAYAGLRWRGHGRWLPVVAAVLCVVSAYALGMFCFMLWGSLVTKVQGREAMLDLIPWTGEEQVLDVGCGRGLLLVGAARRLTTGHATGIDLWLQRDQTGNEQAAPLQNAAREQVRDRVSVLTGDMRDLPFPDACFDVVVSGWAVHNLEEKDGRSRALAEMVRVLKAGGSLLVNDIVYRDEYAAEFRRLGLAEVHVVVPSRWRDGISGLVSFGSFRPATVRGRKRLADVR